MNKRAVIVLGAIALLLIAYVALFERTSLSSKELEERKARVLTTFVRPKVERLELERKGARVVLERKASEEGELGPWKMLEPYQATADEDAVDQVLGELEWLTPRRTLDGLSEADRKSFGLDAPRYRVRYRVGDATHRLVVGKEDVHGDGVYVRVDDEPKAYVVPKTLTEALDHEPGHYRNKEFLGEMTVAWARRLEIEGGGTKLEVEKDAGRFWVLGDPKTYADMTRVDELLRALDDLRATRFVEGADVAAAQGDLQKPARIVRLRLVPEESREDKKPQLVELQLGGACAKHEGERYARAGANGTPVCIKAEDARTFEPGPAELREARLFSADPSEIERLELAVGGQKISLKREGEKWLPEGKLDVDRRAVEIWLSDLAAQRAQAFLPAETLSEHGSLSLKLAGDKSERVVFATATANGVLVKRGDEPALVRFGRETALLLEPSPQRFASLEPWANHQPSEVVAIEARDGTTQRSLVLVDNAWRPTPRAPEVADASKVRELLRALIKLEARNFVSDTARPEQGFATPRARVAFKLATTPPQTLTLEIGNITSHGAFARIDGARVVEVPPQVLAQISELAGAKPTSATPAPPPKPDAGADDEHADHDHDEAHAH